MKVTQLKLAGVNVNCSDSKVYSGSFLIVREKSIWTFILFYFILFESRDYLSLFEVSLELFMLDVYWP